MNLPIPENNTNPKRERGRMSLDSRPRSNFGLVLDKFYDNRTQPRGPSCCMSSSRWRGLWRAGGFTGVPQFLSRSR
ncbi:MAG: hypothetical protein DWH84_05050 [Planctomycetota bacterium]|nr:MAG: hypothetical protein DWH84_05050 [Planctomycetota bacterium]